MHIANSTFLNELKMKENTSIPSNKYRTSWTRQTTIFDNRNIVIALKNNLKTTVGDITDNLDIGGVKVSQYTH